MGTPEAAAKYSTQDSRPPWSDLSPKMSIAHIWTTRGAARAQRMEHRTPLPTRCRLAKSLWLLVILLAGGSGGWCPVFVQVSRVGGGGGGVGRPREAPALPSGSPSPRRYVGNSSRCRSERGRPGRSRLARLRVSVRLVPQACPRLSRAFLPEATKRGQRYQVRSPHTSPQLPHTFQWP